MKKNLWEKKVYYENIKSINLNKDIRNDPIFLEITNLLKNCSNEKILDVGCGEGWLIEQLSKTINKNNFFTGIDVSKTGIKQAISKNVSNAKFINYDGEEFPLPSNYFNVSLSSFVFEHLSDPLKTFNEMSRVTKNEGMIIIACPNFGSPLFKSPCNNNKKSFLMLKRFIKELTPKIYFKNNFRWRKVTPINLPENIHISDYDTLCEPSLSYFKKFINNHKNKYSIIKIDSMWKSYTYNEKNAGLLRKKLVMFARFLGLKKILKFNYFGSFFFIAIKKKC